MMKLRELKSEDAVNIGSWIRSEEELYKWSADQFNRFPVLGDHIIDHYAPQVAGGRFFPMVAVNEREDPVGHFIIRYPKSDDNSVVRFGFVVIDPALRGKGYGREMLRLGIEYVKEHLQVQKVELGVFANNDSARHCYESIGFTEYNRRECALPVGTWECIDMEVNL